MTTTEMHEKSRSYEVREAMGFHGHDGTGWATTLRDITSHAPLRTIPAGTRCRVTTSNAGFRGIEAYAVAPDGTTVGGVSLGAFTA